MKPAKGSVLGRHSFPFNEKDNNGEQLVLTTEMLSAGNGLGVWFNQELILNSYNNSVTFNLGTVLHPKLLRKLADGLEAAIEKAKHNANLDVGVDFDTEMKFIAKEQEQIKKLETEIEKLSKHPLAEHVDTTVERKFSPEPWYNPYGDSISCKEIDTAYFAARVDDSLDMYYTIEDKKPIGFLLKNIQSLLDDDFRRMSDVSIDSLLLCAASGVNDKKLAAEYFKAVKMAKSFTLPLKDLVRANLSCIK